MKVIVHFCHLVFVVSGVFLILICPLKFVLSCCIMDVDLSYQCVDYSSITTTRSRIPLVCLSRKIFLSPSVLKNSMLVIFNILLLY